MSDPRDYETVDQTGEPEEWFGRLLLDLRDGAGMNQRDLAGKLKLRSHSRISEYERRRLPSVPVVEQYEVVFGIPRGSLVKWLVKARAQRDERPFDGTPEVSVSAFPYQGKDAYEIEDAELYFGRLALVESVAARLAETRFVAVVGDSGSGKSSFVRAGLLTRIAATWGRHVTDRHVVLLTPGEHPLDELSRGVGAAIGVDARELAGDLRTDLDRWSARVRRADVSLVIVIDQLEELFTIRRDKAEQRRFADALIAAWSDPSSPVVVIVALRSDCYHHLADHPQLAAAVAAHHELLGPMSEGELRDAIEQPAARAGMRLELGLPDTILADLAGEPGALALLSRVMLETAKRHRKGTLTISGYREAGGVRGAICDAAEATQLRLVDADQAVARRIFLSLIELSEGAAPAGRRVRRDELAAHPQIGRELPRVLGILARDRLVTLERETVVIAHEALVRQWERLGDWIRTDRAGLLLHRRVTADARQWEALSREPGALYRGARLAAAREWAADHAEELSPLEDDFLTAGHAAAQRGVRRLAMLAAGLAALSVIVMVLAALALNQRGDARRQAAEATSLALAASSFQPLRTRPDVSLALAFEGYRMSASAEARSAVVRALVAARESRLRGVLIRNEALVDVTFSRSGHTLAAGNGDGTVRLWNMATRKVRKRLRTGGHVGAINDIAYRSDDRTFATAGADGKVVLWRTRNNSVVGRLDDDAGPISAIAFSSDSTMLASAGEDGYVRLWDVGKRHLIRRLRAPGIKLNDVAFSPDRKTVAAAGADGIVRLWNRVTGELRNALTGHDGAVTAIAFSPDDQTFASASADRTVLLRDAATFEPRRRLHGHTAAVSDVGFSADSLRVATSSLDETVRLWDARTGDQRGANLLGHSGAVLGLAFSNDGLTLATAGADRTVRLWDATKDAEPALLAGTDGNVADVAASPEDATLATAGRDGTVELWNTATGAPSGHLDQHPAAVLAVAFSPDGEKLATGDALGTVRVWDARTHVLRVRRTLHRGRVDEIAFSPDGRTLASASPGDRDVVLWDFERNRLGRRLGDHDGGALALAFSPDGKLLATGGADTIVNVWDAVTGKRLHMLINHVDVVVALAFSPDGRQLVSSGRDPAVRLWNTSTGKSLGRLLGHDDTVNDVAFSSGGAIATAGVDGTVRLWESATRKPLGRLTGHAGGVTAVAFGPNGKTLASAGVHGSVRVWSEVLWTDFAELEAHVCNALLTGLTPSDWKLYAQSIAYRRSCGS